VCFFSTVAVYGDAPEPHHEDSPKSPDSPYGGSKLAGEGVFKAWTEKGDGRRCLVIRPTVTFGVRNFANMYTLIHQVHRGRFFPVGSGSNIKSLSYVENTVDATMHLWYGDGRIPAGFDVFNFIDKPDFTSRKITKVVYDALGKSYPRVSMPLWLALLMALPFDVVIALTGRNLPISRARVRKLATVQTKFEADKLLATGYTPRVALEDGIRKMVAWYLEKGKDISPEWHQPPAEVVVSAEPAPA
jgi:nucleoside-diphosphate-sugar epimerase